MGRKRSRVKAPDDDADLHRAVGVLGSHLADGLGKRLVLQAMVPGSYDLAALPESLEHGEENGGGVGLAWINGLGNNPSLRNSWSEPSLFGESVSAGFAREEREVFERKAATEPFNDSGAEGEEEGPAEGRELEEEISTGGDGSGSESVVEEAPRRRGRRGPLEGILKENRSMGYWKGKVSAFKKKFLSFSSSCARNSRRKQILNILQQMKGKPELPVSAEELTCAATLLNEAKLVSADQYLHEVKLMQVELGFEWNLTLERQLKLCKAALSRNKGPEKRAKEVAIDGLEERTWMGEGTRQADLERPAWCYAWATVWMLRAAEAAKVLVKHVAIKHSPRHVTLLIPFSKMDQKGKGVSRTLQCCGLRECHRWCAWGLALKTLALHKTGKPQDPLFPLVNGKKAKKSCLVRNWQKFLDGEMGGHSARRSGAMAHARAGMSVTCISYLGRWRSSAVLRYVEEALQFIPSNTTEAKSQEGGIQQVEMANGNPQDEFQSKGTSEEEPKKDRKIVEIKKEIHNTHVHEVKLNDVEELYAVAPKRGGGRITHWVSRAAWGVDLNSWATACGWKFAKRFEKVQLTTKPPTKTHMCSKCESILKGRDCVMGGMTLAQMLSDKFNNASEKQTDGQ